MTRREKRRRFSNWLADLFRAPQASAMQRRSILVEPLEARQLLASDGFMALLGSSTEAGSDLSGGSTFSYSTLQGEGELQAEGEDANDLVAFAKALADSGTRFYGAAWCPFCTEQKQLFEDGSKYLPFIEVTNPDRSPNQIAIDEGITEYPTWEFPDGTRLTGVQSLATLAQRAEIAIPQSSVPSFATLGNVNVGIGSPLHIPVDAYDPNGNPLTITVTSSDPSKLTAQVLSGNRSLRISTSNFGDMVFELFEDKAPVPSGRVIELAEDGFYDGVIFHRVINNFVIQGGDPTGTGSGGSTLGDFDDQFHLDLQHNRTGVLSYAKSTDDTNDSQFFITEGPQRFLDFNHSVFGQLTEGELVREAISNTATNSSDRPLNDVVISSATVFEDLENGLIMLKPTGSGTGAVTITVTVSDTEGNSTSQSFVATVIQDTANGAPFLNPIPQVETSVNTPVTVNLTSQDAEGDTVIYSVQPSGSQSFGLTVDSATGVVTVTPPTDFTGQLSFIATVRQSTTPTTSSATDTQRVTVNVTQSAPTSIDLLATSDTGTSSTDDVTKAASLTFSVSGTTSGAVVEVRAGGNVVGSATASGTTTEVTVSDVASLGQGAILFTATQTTGGQTSAATPALTVVLDRDAPAAVDSGAFPASTIVSQPLSIDLEHAEEGQGLVYGLAAAPSGMTIDPGNGQLAWTPATGQLGTQTLTLTLTDAAGNVREQQISINVIEEPLMQISLNAVSLSGSPITTVAAGESFKVQIFVHDLRDGTSRTGVFATYLDLLFDSNVIEPVATNPIRRVAPYENDQSGTIESGLINELGAFSSSTSPVGGEARLFAEVTFLAKAAGNAGLRAEPADSPGNDVLLYGETTAVPVSRVDYGTSDFAVGANFELLPDAFNFDEDSGAHSLNVLSNDTVSGGAVLTITAVSTPSGGGTVSIASDGKTLNYTSASNFTGAEVFTYTAQNQEGVARTATVTVQVTDVNDPPVARNDTFTVFQNSSQNVLQVLVNDDTGVDDETLENLQVTAVSAGSAGGNITIGSSGLTVRYSPRAAFQGTETFTYTISDGRGGTATATVSVSVEQENPPPTPQDDTFTVVEDAAQASFDVLANDTTNDPGETLSISAVGASQVGSQFSVASDGLSVLYRPAANFNGQEVLTYTLRDSGGATAIGRVTFNVTAVNDPPDAVDDNLTALSSQTTTNLNVLANDTNVDTGETLTITAVTQPPTGKGTVAIAADGKSLIYTSPSTSFEGTFAFTYTISDGNGLSDTATVNLDVQNFVPRSLSGTLFYGDSNVIGGFPIKLAGNDLVGTAVSLSAQVGVDGKFAFNNLAPGEYNIIRDPLPFLNDTGSSVNVRSDVNDGDMVTDLVVSGGLRPEFFDIRDFLGSTFQNSLTVAVNADGSQNWYASRGSWSQLSSLGASVSSSNSLTINAVNSSQQNLRATLPIVGTRVTQVGSQSSMRLLRVHGSTTAAGLAPVTTSSATTAASSTSTSLSGEGEGPASPPIATPQLASGVSSGVVSRGGVTNSSGVSDELTPTQAIRQLLGSASVLGTGSTPAAALSAGAVDSAMEDLLPALRRQLSSELEATLTSPETGNPGDNDAAVDEL